MSLEGVKEFGRKHYVALIAFAVVVGFWLYTRRNKSSSAAAPSYAATPNIQYSVPTNGVSAGNGGSSFVDTTGGVGSVNQPGTTSSGVPSANPAVVPYISPSNNIALPSPDTQASAFGNPYSNGAPNSGGGIISAIQAAITGVPASTPSGGATTVDPAIVNTLQAARIPGALAALPSNDPYLTSDAYTSLQRGINQRICADNPNSPGCQVATATGELATGSPTTASEVYRATVYCEGNNFNAGFFGSAPDSTNCTGPNPNGGLVASLITQFIPQSQPSTWGANSAVGNLPANWNQLTRDQQDAWSHTGVVPPGTAPIQPPPATAPANAPPAGIANPTTITGGTAPTLNRNPVGSFLRRIIPSAVEVM